MKNEQYKESCRYGRLWEPENDEGCHEGKKKTRPKGIDPRAERFIPSRPLRSKPAAHDLKGEVNEDNEGEILSPESFFN